MSRDIETMTTHEICQEIMRRIDHGFISVVVPKGNSGKCETREYAWGNRFAVLGMLTAAQKGRLDDILEDRENKDDEDV